MRCDPAQKQTWLLYFKHWSYINRKWCLFKILLTLDWLVNTPQREKSVTAILLLSHSLFFPFSWRALFHQYPLSSMLVCFGLLWITLGFAVCSLLEGGDAFIAYLHTSTLYNANAIQQVGVIGCHLFNKMKCCQRVFLEVLEFLALGKIPLIKEGELIHFPCFQGRSGLHTVWHRLPSSSFWAHYNRLTYSKSRLPSKWTSTNTIHCTENQSQWRLCVFSGMNSTTPDVVVRNSGFLQPGSYFYSSSCSFYFWLW